MGELVFVDFNKGKREEQPETERALRERHGRGAEPAGPKSAHLEYVNRKGQRYLLCETVTRTGKPRFVFSREPVGTPVQEIPAGYKVAESVNGVVSLRKVGSCQIRDEELAVVQGTLAKHPRLRHCRVEARKQELVVHEANTAGLEQFAKEFPGREAALERVVANAPLTPALRFVLQDQEKRTFDVQRRCYRSGAEGWRTLGEGPLEQLAARYLPHIGRDSFFELG